MQVGKRQGTGQGTPFLQKEVEPPKSKRLQLALNGFSSLPSFSVSKRTLVIRVKIMVPGFLMIKLHRLK